MFSAFKTQSEQIFISFISQPWKSERNLNKAEFSISDRRLPTMMHCLPTIDHVLLHYHAIIIVFP